MRKLLTCILLLCCTTRMALALDVVFRLDDPTLSKSEFTNRIVELFANKGIPLSIAIVPFDEFECPITQVDSLLIDKLRSGGVFELCVHGMNHLTICEAGEFGGISRAEAKRRLELALNYLNNYSPNKIRTFIPPFNAIGSLSMLEIKQRCSIISSDMYSRAFTDGIDYYPETLGHLMDNRSVWDAAFEVLREKHGRNEICVIMFHHYDLKDESDWNMLSSILDYCKGREQFHLHTFSSLQDSGNHSSWRRIRANQLENGLRKLILKKGVLYPTFMCYIVHIANALIYALILLLFLAVLCGVRESVSPIFKILYVVLAAVAFVFAYLHILGPLKLLAAVLFVGICILLKFRK